MAEPAATTTLVLANPNPTFVRGKRKWAPTSENYRIFLGRLAVCTGDDGLPARKDTFPLREFVASIEEAELETTSSPTAFVSQTLHDLIEQLDSTIGNGKELLVRQPRVSVRLSPDLVEVDVADAAHELRELRSIIAAGSVTSDAVHELDARLQAAQRIFRAAYSSGDLVHSWLVHIDRALHRALCECHLLRIHIWDALSPDTHAIAAIESSSVALRQLGDASAAFVGEIKSALDEPHLSIVGDRAAAHVEGLNATDPLRMKAELAIGDALRQQWRRLRPRGVHNLGRGEEWVGREALLQKLTSFWLGHQGGVLALVGIGGAGKTALVRRFLEINGWLDPPYSTEGPDGIFIWACYEDESVPSLVREASRFFERFLTSGQLRALGKTPSEDVGRLVETLRKADGRFLIILDGLERLQVEDPSTAPLRGDEALPGERAGFGYTRGEFEDPALRRLLRSIASDTDIKVIATSRESLTTLAGAGERYRELDATQMDEPSALGLLQAQGVIGDVDSLRSVARQFDFHALTLLIVGDDLKLHHRGNPAAAALLDDLRNIPGEDKSARAQRKLAAVLDGVSSRLDSTEEALLSTVAALSMPLSVHRLGRIVRRYAKGQKVQIPTQSVIEKSVNSLTSRGLAFLTEDRHGNPALSSHVLVRNFYYARLTPAVRGTLHELINMELIELTKELTPEHPDYSAVLRERFRQLMAVGRHQEAYEEIYADQLGGYLGLGWRDGRHHDGARLMQMFIEGAVEDPQLRHRATLDGVLHFKNLGLLDEAAGALERLEIEDEDDPANASETAQNLAGIFVMRGWLDRALQAARRATQYAQATETPHYLREASARLADVAARIGDAETARQAHQSVIENYSPDAHIHQLPGLSVAWLSVLQGDWEAAAGAMAFARSALEERERIRGSALGMLRARFEAQNAVIALEGGDLEDAQRSADYLFEWGLRRSTDQEMVVVAHLAAGRLARAEGNLDGAARAFGFAADVASEGGLGLHWIDAQVEQAAVALLGGSSETAQFHAEAALAGRNEPSEPAILGCGGTEPAYLWGALAAHRVRRDAHRRDGSTDAASRETDVVLELEARLGVVSPS